MDAEERISRLEAQLRLVESYSVGAFWHAIDKAYEAILPKAELRCIVCDHKDGRSGFKILRSRCMFGGGELERYQCPACDAIFGPQKYLDLSDDFVNSDYALLYSRYAESDSTTNEVRTFESLTPTSGGPYLNWGCGDWSKSITALRDRGFDVWGYEPSAATTQSFVVKERGAISAKFRGIFSNNVIEHFRNPVAQFRDFASILSPSGAMAHSSPCYEHRYDFTRFHTFFPLGRSPFVLAEKTGFVAKEVCRQGEYINFLFALK